MKNALDTLLAQYANSPRIVGLIQLFNQWIDPQVDLDTFFNYVWNVDTAVGFGLDIWGAIVDVSRNIQVSTVGLYLGFNEATLTGSTTNPQPFNQAPFWNGPPATQTYTLADDAYRKLILVKALANITDCTIVNLNKLLLILFQGEGRCYVNDLGNMVMRYTFEFDLSPVEMSIMINSTAVPRPAGVLAQVMTVAPQTTFGFQEASGQPFGSGVFFNTSGIQNAK